MNSKSVFEALIRSVPPRLASDEPDFVGALALAAPAKLEATSSDPTLQESVRTARRRLAGEVEAALQEPTPIDMQIGIGAG